MMPAPSIVARRSRLLRFVDWYQQAFAGRPSPCRFTPSCSSYAREALETYGTRRGLWLTIRRLARCRPLGPSGFDPVPLPHDGRPRRHGHGSTPSAISRVPSGISVVPSGISVVPSGIPDVKDR